jgi:putative oxidoreductase
MGSMPQRLQISGSRAIILIRLMVGIVFLSEGIQKFLYPAEMGPGRFAKIGIPSPELMGPFVGVAEIVCGTLILLGLFVRLAAVVMLIDVSVALLSTKLPILLRRAVGPFSLPKLPRYGVWSSLHEARVDLCMWLGSLFLILVSAKMSAGKTQDDGRG